MSLFGPDAPPDALLPVSLSQNPLLCAWQRFMIPAIEYENKRMLDIERRLGAGTWSIDDFTLSTDPEALALEARRLLREPGMIAHRARHKCVKRYAWAVPSPSALATVAKYSPLVEIGAGTGYWAWLLRRDHRAEILPYDRVPPGSAGVRNHWHTPLQFVTVHQGGPEQAARFPGRALFLCWPPYDDPMAADCLRAYEGDTVIFIGEHDGGCCANDVFFDQLGTSFEEIKRVAIPQWQHIHDSLSVWKRK